MSRPPEPPQATGGAPDSQGPPAEMSPSCRYKSRGTRRDSSPIFFLLIVRPGVMKGQAPERWPHGERTAQIRDADWSLQTFMDAGWVARKIETSRRRGERHQFAAAI